MGKGSGALGFGAGLAKGLAGGYLRNIETKRAAEQKKADQERQNDIAMLQWTLQQGTETGDFSAAQQVLTRLDPSLANKFKKEGSPFEHLAPLLTQGNAAWGQTEQPDSSVADYLSGQVGQGPSTPSPPAPNAQQSQGRWTFGGTPLMSPDERVGQEVKTLETTTRAKVDLARRMLPILQQADPTATMDDALAAVGIKTASASARANGVFRYGVDREALAKGLYNKRFDDLTLEEAQVVLAEEKTMLEAEAKSRGTGTADARFNARIDIPTAQTSGQPVGTRASDLAGQGVPPLAIVERRRSLEAIKDSLGRVRELIGVLPSETTLSGVAPGGVLAARRRMNTDSGLKGTDGKPMSYRTAIAQLEAVIENMVNVLARSLAEQKGSQTEKDAERAYNAVVNLKAGLTNPLGGDTQESALARIDETYAGLERVIASLPTAPVPKKDAAPTGAKAAPAATASQFSVVYDDGKGPQVYSFPNQAALDLFKRQFGIK